MNETNAVGAKEAIDKGGVVLVDLHADWCTFCKKTRPHLDKIDGEREDITMVAIDTDMDPDAYDNFAVKTLPTVILYRDGEELARRGSGDYEELNVWLSGLGV